MGLGCCYVNRDCAPFVKFALMELYRTPETQRLQRFVVANCNYVQFIDILLVGDRSAKMSGITFSFIISVNSWCTKLKKSETRTQ